MPDIIDSSFQSTTVGQPISFKKDIDFLQYGRRDETAIIIESLLGSNYDKTKTYILKGCVKSSSAGTTIVTPGYIFGIDKVFGGLVSRTYAYFHPGSSFADPVGPNVVVCKTTTTYPAGDPITFTDSSTHDVHMIINVEFSAGASGSGDVDFSDLLNFVPPWINVGAFGSGWIAGGSGIPKYKSNPPLNEIELYGLAVSNASPPGADILTLPAGFRPPELIFRSIPKYDVGSDTFSQITIEITPGGLVRIYSPADIPIAAGDFVSLYGLSFSTY